MYTEINIIFLGIRHDRVKEVSDILEVFIGRDAVIELDVLCHLRESFRFPSRKRHIARAIHHGVDDLLQIERLRIIVVIGHREASVRKRKLKGTSEPVHDRHEVIADALDACFGKILHRGDVIRDIFVSRGKSFFNILVDIDALDDFHLQPCGMDLITKSGDVFLRPDLAGGNMR